MAAASAGTLQPSSKGHSGPIASTSANQRVTYISRVPHDHHVVESTSVRMNYNLAPGWKRLLANGEIIYLR